MERNSIRVEGMSSAHHPRRTGAGARSSPAGRWPGLWVVAAVAIGAVFAMTSPTGVRAGTERLAYDPTTCATDPGDTVTVALRRIVLQLPISAPFYMMAWSPEKLAAMPVPPDPSQPRGCPDHPIQVHGVDLSIALQVPEQGLDAPPTRLSVERLSFVAADADQWGLQPGWERSFQHTCESFGLVNTTGEGFTVCRVRPTYVEQHPEETWPYDAQAPLDYYSSPFGRVFTTSCFYQVASVRRACDVAYKFYENLNVAYRYNALIIPLDRLIDFDRALRDWIQSARVSDFEWSDEDGRAAEGAL